MASKVSIKICWCPPNNFCRIELLTKLEDIYSHFAVLQYISYINEWTFEVRHYIIKTFSVPGLNQSNWESASGKSYMI